MPYLKPLLHMVWATKNRYPFLVQPIRKEVFKHIRENAREKGIYMDCINGYDDHVHCLVSLGSDQTINKVLQLIKGESSFWINKEKLCALKFEWQDDYFAVSVSPSDLQRVRKYIYNQEIHHQRKSFQEEYEELIRQYGSEEKGQNEGKNLLR